MRNLRQDMQRQRDVMPEEYWRSGGGWQGGPVGPGRQAGREQVFPDDGADPRALRRLSPEERQRLRRDLRDAAREVYIQR